MKPQQKIVKFSCGNLPSHTNVLRHVICRAELPGADVHSPGGQEEEAGPLAPGFQPAADRASLPGADAAARRPPACLGQALHIPDSRVRWQERYRLAVRHKGRAHPGTSYPLEG